MFERCTDSSRRVIVYAQAYASEYHHYETGVDLVLLSLVLQAGAQMEDVWHELAWTEARLREVIETSHGYGRCTELRLPFDKYARETLERAMRDVAPTGPVEPKHILLGAVQVHERYDVPLMIGLSTPADVRVALHNATL